MERIKPKKSLGQNFLKDEGIIARIIKAAKVGPADLVLEIGPGTGVLTKALESRVKKLVAIEIDHALVERLQKHFVHSKSVSILEGNILEIHAEELLGSFDFPDRGYKVIANIPYYITAPIIRMLLSLSRQPKTLTLMVQAEVADRLAAEPGDMSLLSVMAQYYAEVKKEFMVPKEAFDPAPAVESAIVTLSPARPFFAEGDRKFFGMVRAGFAARRKTLANNLSASLKVPKDIIERLLEKEGLRKDIRAQALSLPEWERLVSVLNEEASRYTDRDKQSERE